jgi:hypothetical protein
MNEQPKLAGGEVAPSVAPDAVVVGEFKAF